MDLRRWDLARVRRAILALCEQAMWNLHHRRVLEKPEDFSDGLALVKQDGRSLFIDAQGQVVLQPQADRVGSFNDGLAVVKVGALHGYIDKRGQTVIAPRFSFARPFHHGLAYVGQGRSSGYIAADGQFVWRTDGP